METITLAHAWNEVELYLWVYAACAWMAFGVYAHGHKQRWSLKEAFGAVIHAANSGILSAWAGVDFVGVNEPWKVMAIACGVSVGWTQKAVIVELLSKLLRNGKKP
jgi:hypothetical protein